MNEQLKEYIRVKARILRQCGILLSDEELEHMKSLTREFDIDNYAHDIIINSEQNYIRKKRDYEHEKKCKPKLKDLKANLLYLKRKTTLPNHILAKAMNIPKSSFDAYTFGYHKPSVERQKTMAKYFGVNPYKDLFMRHDEFVLKY